ncbi:hypothetical protein B0T18DRAFT_401721, partial [Schizothecium vesticola]
MPSKICPKAASKFTPTTPMSMCLPGPTRALRWAGLPRTPCSLDEAPVARHKVLAVRETFFSGISRARGRPGFIFQASIWQMAKIANRPF